MKFLFLIACLTVLVDFVQSSCAPVGYTCDNSKSCCGSNTCSNNRCVQSKSSLLTKCKADKDCNGVKGSCSRGYCNYICNSDDDCGKHRICFGKEESKSGHCVFDDCAPIGQPCNTYKSKRCCKDSFCSSKKKVCVPKMHPFKPNCKSDKECNGARGSCSKGKCLNICRSNDHCGEYGLCAYADWENGGYCLSCKPHGEQCFRYDKCCRRHKCDANYTCILQPEDTETEEEM